MGGVVEVKAATAGDREFITATHIASWGGLLVARQGELVDLATLPTLVAWLDGERAGLLTYLAKGGDWEVVSIDAAVPERGVGSALLTAVRTTAEQAGAQRLWLITTNDNVRAIRFYQRNGFDLAALHRDGVTRSRAVKPSIPLEIDGIPLRHELEFEVLL
jgi:ribosomal protein S18 acetylase RimI-like enzyme